MTVKRAGSILLTLAITACGGGSQSPTAPTSQSQPSPPNPQPAPPAPTPAPAPAPTPAPASFTVSLPIRPEDSRHNAFGVNSFGIHIGDHGADGHPGWDFEYAVGASILAAAEGTIQSVMPSEGGAAFGIQISHVMNGRNYRTDYGVGTLAPEIAPGATVVAGQPLGIAAAYTRTIGTVTVTYAFTHFQLDDFSKHDGLTNPNAVSPENYLDSAARQAFETIWRDAVYYQELVEPFITNPRNVVFPMTRTWTLQAGGLAPRVDFTRAHNAANDFTYVLRDASGASLDTGTAEINPLAKPLSTIDFIPAGGQRRLGVYSVLGGTMQLQYGAPGAARPTSLAGSSEYRTPE
ncbi:MAG: hypothetical protein HYZ58_06890 [Acidobacteria bacterium]|nr:hypothetical protein [Acidobacteriota bacterium]